MIKDLSILINLFAQDKVELEIVLKVFKELNLDEKRSALAWLRTYVEQSHPAEDTIDEAIRNMPIERTMTPIVILGKNDLRSALWKICELPEDELERSFITLLTLFRFSDTKRRETYCKNGCDHDWHNIERRKYSYWEANIQRLTNWWKILKNKINSKS